MVINKYLSLSETAEMLGKSKETLRRWDRDGILNAVREPVSNYRLYKRSDVENLMGTLFEGNSLTDQVTNEVKPLKTYNVLELFAGAGG